MVFETTWCIDLTGVPIGKLAAAGNSEFGAPDTSPAAVWRTRNLPRLGHKAIRWQFHRRPSRAPYGDLGRAGFPARLTSHHDCRVISLFGLPNFRAETQRSSCHSAFRFRTSHSGNCSGRPRGYSKQTAFRPTRQTITSGNFFERSKFVPRLSRREGASSESNHFDDRPSSPPATNRDRRGRAERGIGPLSAVISSGHGMDRLKA
jgi:hypothetical protein